MNLTLNCKAVLSGIKPETRQHIQSFLTMLNPAFTAAEKMGRYTGNILQSLAFYDDLPWRGLSCPRGAAARLHEVCKQHGEQIHVVDERLSLDPVDFQFHGTLRPLQGGAVNSVLERDHGTLSAPTGAGKTCMGLYTIALR